MDLIERNFKDVSNQGMRLYNHWMLIIKKIIVKQLHSKYYLFSIVTEWESVRMQQQWQQPCSENCHYVYSVCFGG